MKNSYRSASLVLLALQLCGATEEPFRIAAPGYRYSFPRDHFSHAEFQTEWWYYTGNLRTREGRRFGFELTFFRQGVDRKADPNAHRKADQHADAKADRQGAPAADRRADPKADRKPDPKGTRQANPKADRQGAPAVDRQADPKADRKPDPKGTRQADPKADRQVAPAADRQADPKGDRKADPTADRETAPPQVWEVRDLWLAHLAVSDLDAGRFLHTERLNRSGAGIAGADLQQARVWNGNWQAQWKLDPRAPGAMTAQQLSAVAEHFSFELAMKTTKSPVIHGENGISQKAEGPGRASHYISFTRLLTSGVISIEGQRFNVDGESWMDHEFFTHQLAANQTGWDWFSLQFEDGSELMLFELRRKDGALDPYSAGTYIDSQGRARHLSAKDFALAPGMTWTSPVSGGRYPIAWTVRVPSLNLDCALTTRLPQQELTGKTRSAPTYWEGAIEVTATRKAQPLKGQGYLEMTGYAGQAPTGE